MKCPGLYECSFKFPDPPKYNGGCADGPQVVEAKPPRPGLDSSELWTTILLTPSRTTSDRVVGTGIDHPGWVPRSTFTLKPRRTRVLLADVPKPSIPGTSREKGEGSGRAQTRHKLKCRCASGRHEELIFEVVSRPPHHNPLSRGD